MKKDGPENPISDTQSRHKLLMPIYYYDMGNEIFVKLTSQNEYKNQFHENDNI